jgi:hypothetical protein
MILQWMFMTILEQVNNIQYGLSQPTLQSHSITTTLKNQVLPHLKH